MGRRGKRASLPRTVASDIANPWDGVGRDDIHVVLDREIEHATEANPLPLTGPGGEVSITWSWDNLEDDATADADAQQSITVQA